MKRRVDSSMVVAALLAAVALQLLGHPANASVTNAICSATMNANLGEYNPQRALISGMSRTGTVRVTCGVAGLAIGQRYQVTVDIQPGSGGSHVMQNPFAPGKPLKYDILFSDGRVWLDGSGRSEHFVTQFTATGTQTVPVEIRIGAGQDAAVGGYSDPSLTFVVTVSGPM